MKQRIFRLGLAAAVLAGGIAFNTNAATERPLPHRGLAERAKDRLGLTDEQVTKIKSELASEKESIKDLLHRLHTARTELREVIQQPGASDGSIRDAAAKVASVEADAAVLRAKLYKSVSAVLTDEQKTKMKEAQHNVGHLMERLMDRLGESKGRQ